MLYPPPHHTYEEGKAAGIRCFLQGHSVDTRLLGFNAGLDSAQLSSVAVCPENLWSFHPWRYSKYEWTSHESPELCWPCSEQGRDDPWCLLWTKFFCDFKTEFPMGAELHLECLSCKDPLSSLFLIAKHERFSLLSLGKKTNTSTFEKEISFPWFFTCTTCWGSQGNFWL